MKKLILILLFSFCLSSNADELISEKDLRYIFTVISKIESNFNSNAYNLELVPLIVVSPLLSSSNHVTAVRLC